MRNYYLFIILAFTLAAGGCVKNLNRQIVTEPHSFYSSNPHLYLTFPVQMTEIGSGDKREYVQDDARHIIGREWKETHLLANGKNGFVANSLIVQFKTLDTRWIYDQMGTKDFEAALQYERIKLGGNEYHMFIKVEPTGADYANLNSLTRNSIGATFHGDYLQCGLTRTFRSNELITIIYLRPLPVSMQHQVWNKETLTDDQKWEITKMKGDLMAFITFNDGEPASLSASQ